MAFPSTLPSKLPDSGDPHRQKSLYRHGATRQRVLHWAREDSLGTHKIIDNQGLAKRVGTFRRRVTPVIAGLRPTDNLSAG
jgi:hypothetical protein